MGREPVLIATVLLAVIVLLAMDGPLAAVLAQTGPFGAPRPQAPPPAADGFTGWLMAKQAEFYRMLSGTIRAAKTDGTAVLSLFGIAFLYGIFHAAGPGHGKAVISSYMVANEEAWRRGVVLSFASAMLQALVAITIVGIGAIALGATARMMGEAVRWIEIASYALIAALGAWLLWVKGRALLAELGMMTRRPAMAAGAAATHGHDHHHHDHHPHHDGAQAHQHGHAHAAACGHVHGPEPKDLAGPGGWRRGLSAIVAVGLRPCSGAILVLVFALAQGLFWAGVVATFLMGLGTAITVAAIATLAVSAKTFAGRLAKSKSGYGMVALRGVEVAAAVLVLAFGILLLSGYMAQERMFPV
jgi:nickel/cobalt exporter